MKKWPDNLRSIATIAVIMLHVAAPSLYEFNIISMGRWDTANIYDSAVRFCVPVFFMLSGALLLNKDYVLSEFLKKRFLRIVPPLIFWSIIYIIYKIIYSNITFSSVKDVLINFISNLSIGSFYHLWFVYTLLGLYLFIPVIRKYVKQSSNKEVLYFIAIWFVTILLSVPYANSYIPKIDLVNFSGYLGYMVLGYYLSNLKTLKWYIPFGLFSIGTLITIFGTKFLTNKSGHFDEYFYGYLTPNVLMSAIGIFLFFKDFKIKSKPIDTIFATISRYSYGIYLVHALVLHLLFEIVDAQFIHPIISIPFLTLTTLVISTLIVCLGKKIKPISFLIG